MYPLQEQFNRVWHQYDSFSIQYSNGHRHKTPAIARCFTFYTTVSTLRRKYMEERRERVIRLSSDSTSFLQNCMVDYFGELWFGLCFFCSSLVSTPSLTARVTVGMMREYKRARIVVHNSCCVYTKSPPPPTLLVTLPQTVTRVHHGRTKTHDRTNKYNS